MTTSTYRNPWSRQIVARERQYFADTEAEMGGAINEANHAEQIGWVPCGQCGAKAWHKPTIGTFKCGNCGSLRIRGGEWSPR